MLLVSEEPKKAKQAGPDFHMRLGDEKADWQKEASQDGIEQLGTWVKKVVRDHIKANRAKRAREAKRDQ